MGNTHESVVCIMLCALAPLTASCMSQTPYPMTYSFSTQNKMQAVEHWRTLAKDVSKALSAKIGRDKPLYIANDRKEPVYVFTLNFLQEELMNAGFTIAQREAPGVLKITIFSKVIEHNEKTMETVPGFFSALGTGIWVAVAGANVVEDSQKPHFTREVLITLKVWDGVQLTASLNNVYYINGDESWQYDASPYVAGANDVKRTVQPKTMVVTGD